MELVDDGSLRVLGGSWDPARSDAEVLAGLIAGGADLGVRVLARHHLRLPDDTALTAAAALLADEGYRVHLLDPDQHTAAGRPSPDPAHEPGVAVVATRAEVVTGLSLAQERSRMAGLAQRLGGDATGWDLLGAPPRAPQDR